MNAQVGKEKVRKESVEPGIVKRAYLATASTFSAEIKLERARMFRDWGLALREPIQKAQKYGRAHDLLLEAGAKKPALVDKTEEQALLRLKANANFLAGDEKRAAEQNIAAAEYYYVAGNSFRRLAQAHMANGELRTAEFDLEKSTFSLRRTVSAHEHSERKGGPEASIVYLTLWGTYTAKAHVREELGNPQGAERAFRLSRAAKLVLLGPKPSDAESVSMAFAEAEE